VFGHSLSDNGNLFALLGQPTAPYWDGHFSNGPTYAEQLAQLLHVPLNDFAFGGAEASDTSPPVTHEPLPINLSDQIAHYIAQLNGSSAPSGNDGTHNIGSNDYGGIFAQVTQPDPQQFIASVVGSIEQGIDALTNVGKRLSFLRCRTLGLPGTTIE
jgi:hypothetical protein